MILGVAGSSPVSHPERPAVWQAWCFGNHNGQMPIRQGLITAGVVAALAAVGCSTAATKDSKSAEPTVTAAADAPAPAVSPEQQQQAQQLAEEAEKIMLDPALAPREKYPKALGMFRDALTIDPDNALATQSIALIEDIYRSMGRPVPQPT